MKYKFAELTVLAATIFFIAVTVFSSAKTADYSFLASSTDALCAVDGIEPQDALYLKKNFGTEPSQIGEFLCYASGDVMNPTSVIAVELSDESAAEELYNAVKEYNTDKYNTFISYAPDVGGLLSNAVIEKSGCVVFYYCGEQYEKAADIFTGSKR